LTFARNSMEINAYLGRGLLGSGPPMPWPRAGHQGRSPLARWRQLIEHRPRRFFAPTLSDCGDYDFCVIYEACVYNAFPQTKVPHNGGGQKCPHFPLFLPCVHHCSAGCATELFPTLLSTCDHSKIALIRQQRVSFGSWVAGEEE